MSIIIGLLMVGSAIWVYWDATQNRIGRIAGAKTFFNMSAGFWSFLTALLWIIGMPAYLLNRNKLIRLAKSNPIDAKNRGLKIALLCALGIIIIGARLMQKGHGH